MYISCKASNVITYIMDIVCKIAYAGKYWAVIFLKVY